MRLVGLLVARKRDAQKIAPIQVWVLMLILTVSHVWVFLLLDLLLTSGRQCECLLGSVGDVRPLTPKVKYRSYLHVTLWCIWVVYQGSSYL